jgi:23S rRNA (uracil-5-)-methyltransferase RumA
MYVLHYFRESNETFFHRKRHIGTLRHLVIRQGTFTGELLLLLSTTSGISSHSLTPLIEGLRQLPLEGQLVGFLHSINDGVADAVKNENTHLLWGRDYYNEELSGLKFKVSAFSFFQTNVAGAEELYKIVRDFATTTPANLAYDLYCGTGTISQIISPLFKKVVGIELIEDAITAARENAELNGIKNCEFFAGDVGAILGAGNPDVVIVDPPRDGLHPKTLPQIAKLNAPKLIYVACKPKSLARDIEIFAESDYIPAQIVSIDMFPRTPHVECVCLMVRK